MNSEEKELIERVEALEERVGEVEKGFPNKDYAGHARYHQAVIDEFLERKKLKAAVIEQIVKGSVWALFLAMCGALWTYAKDHIFKVPS